jgi:uncharacterized phage-like protein YoqJ
MNIDKSIAIAFTGHRSNRIITDRETLTQEVENAIITYYSRGFRHFMTGMSEGFDLLTAEAVLKIKNLHTDIKLIPVMPFTGQARRYSDEDKRRYENILKQCDESVMVTDRYFTGCFHRRNDFMIDNASLVIAYYDGIKNGGTHYTVEQAKTKQIPVINVLENIVTNVWWNNSIVDMKALFSGINSETASDYHYRTFWNKLDQTDRNNLHQYWQYRKGIINMGDDDANSLLMEIICELADIALENEFGKSREDMCDNEGSFYEEYQDRFNDLYDDIEDRLLNNHF